MLFFVYLRIRLSEGLARAAVSRRAAPGLEFPAFKSLVELIGVEPTTSSLQSWRSTN